MIGMRINKIEKNNRENRSDQNIFKRLATYFFKIDN